MYILLFFAWLAGLITVLSPCVLPVLPILLAAGAGRGQLRPYGVVCGLVLSFAFFTLSLTALVQWTGISPDFLRYLAVALIAFFGCTMLFENIGNRFAAATSGIANLGLAIQEKSGTIQSGFWSGFVLGIALGLIWTPCAGPILASITTLVATRAVTWQAVLVTLAYSLGAALPMLLIMLGGKKIISTTMSFGRYTQTIRKVFGILMIAAALSIAFHFDTVLQQLALKYFPVLNIEDNPLVEKELESLAQPTHPHVKVPGDTKAAPDFIGITGWINSPPLTLEKLRGKPVLIDFWTYSCINCVRTFPYLKKWYDTYKDKGFVIVGVHTPEFEFEKNLDNVKNAVNRFGITYPVALDNNYKTWQNFNNHYWPAHYLIDQTGHVVYRHYGEGHYKQTENAIRSLLGLPALKEELEPVTKQQTPETYLGYLRGTRYPSDMKIKKNKPASYVYKAPLYDDMVGLQGEWIIGRESIKAVSDGAIIELNFLANHVYLVMKAPQSSEVHVLLDGKDVPKNYETIDMHDSVLRVHDARMYTVLDLKSDHSRHVLKLICPKDITAYAFTFGSNSH